jgi:catecholate siderophore receptor
MRHDDVGRKQLSTIMACALASSMLVSTEVAAQEAAPTELPPVEITAQNKKAVAKKKAAPAPAGQPAPVAAPESVAGNEGEGGLSSNGSVDGYLATRSSTATKTDTPLIDIPQSITVVPKELAKDQGSRDMRQALSYVPGIVVGQGEGHRDAPTIRGVSTTADFFVDGVRDDVQYFRDLYNIDRIEVLKGPNAMIFGRGGGGGVINRVTKKADGERLYEATTTYGSFDTKRVEVDAGQAVTKDFAVRINGMYEDSGSYRDFVDMERYGINPKIMFRPDENTKVHLAYEYFSDDRTVDRGIPSNALTGKPAKTDESTYFGNPDESYMTLESHVGNAIIEHKFDNGVQIKNHTQYGHYEKHYQNVYANSALNQSASISAMFPTSSYIALGAYGQTTERDSFFNQTDVTTKIDMGKFVRHTLLAGVEFGRQTSDNQRDRYTGNYAVTPVLFNDPVTSQVPAWGTAPGPFTKTDLSLVGVYVQDQVEITKYFDLIGGVRFDRFDIDYTCRTDTAANPTARCSNGTSDVITSSFDRVDDVWSPRVGAVLKPVDTLSFYASYSKSFLPGSGEQFASLSGGVTGTANLRPEEFTNKEVGFKWEVSPRLFFTGALFQLDRENTLVAISATESVQAGKTRTEGGELALTGYLTDQWEVVAGYGYQEAEIVSGSLVGSGSNLPTDGKEVALVPRHTFSLWNKYQFLPNWAAGLGVISRSDMFTSANNTVSLPGFARVDAALFWDINENFKAQLNVENVFDIDYYSTAHSDNNITPGSPRAFFLTVTSRF